MFRLAETGFRPSVIDVNENLITPGRVVSPGQKELNVVLKPFLSKCKKGRIAKIAQGGVFLDTSSLNTPRLKIAGSSQITNRSGKSWDFFNSRSFLF